jgi:Tfp pilus assembly protein PilX
MMRLRSAQTGQTLIALLVFISIAMLVTMAAAAVTLINVQSNSSYANGSTALQVAESGVDNAMQRILRNPNYTGETLTIGDGTATITVSGTTTKTIVSRGTCSGLQRTITATATYNATVLTLNSWSETP